MTSALHLTRTFLTVLMLTVAGQVAADNATCHNGSSKIEALICQSPDLSDFADFADVLGDLVNHDIRAAEDATLEDVGLTHIVNNGLSMLTLADVPPLIKAAESLAWEVSFDPQHNIVFINARQAAGQDAIVVFDPAATPTTEPIHAGIGYVFDAVRNTYRMNGDILEVTSWARPAESVHKFRYQDGCWRLIGEDRVWADYMVEYNDDLAAYSINHLIGLAIFDYKEQSGVRRTFDVAVECLDHNLWDYQITYHDTAN